MIKVNEIEKKLPFPTVDFKFQNTGNGKAFLHEFVINIKSIKIDLNPHLKFRYEISNSELVVVMRNYGYGSAINGNFSISETLLDELLIDNSFKFEINSDEEKEVARIGRESFHNPYEPFLLNDKIRLGNMTINWECENEDKELIQNVNSFTSSYDPSSDRDVSPVFVNSNGFFIEERIFQSIMACMRMPSEIYCAIIDSSFSYDQKSYSISREIAAGDIDRFHIMIGSDKSVKIELSFSFKLDYNKTIESDLFEINIWKPLNQRLYDHYLDGDILRAQLEEKVVDIKKDKWDLYELERLKKKLERIKSDNNYPFFKKDNIDGLL